MNCKKIELSYEDSIDFLVETKFIEKDSSSEKKLKWKNTELREYKVFFSESGITFKINKSNKFINFEKIEKLIIERPMLTVCNIKVISTDEEEIFKFSLTSSLWSKDEVRLFYSIKKRLEDLELYIQDEINNLAKDENTKPRLEEIDLMLKNVKLKK